MGQTKSRSNPALNQQTLASTTLRGLYATCEWDERSIRSLIIAKRLAPIALGASDETRISNLTAIVPVNYEEECPICFLYYKGGLNRATCCSKSMCTECFLQVRPPTRRSVCPFCNSDTFHVNFRGPLTVDEIRREEKDRAVLEAHEQRILTEARKSSNARQLAPHDLGISPADVVLVGSPPTGKVANATANDECSADTTDDDANRVPLDAATGTPAVPSPLFERERDHDDSSLSDESAAQQQPPPQQQEQQQQQQQQQQQPQEEEEEEQQQAFSIGEAVLRASADNNGDLASALNRFFGGVQVPASMDVSGMSLNQIDDALLEEAIRLSLADSAPAPPAVSHVNRTVSLSASAAESAAESSLESPLESPRAALQSLPIAVSASLASSGSSSRVKHASKVSAVAHARLHQQSGGAPRTRPSHARSSSTSSRSDEYESDSLDPANRNACSSSTSCADLSDPEDDSPAVTPSRTSARRRRKGGMTVSSSSNSSAPSSNNSSRRSTLAPANAKASAFHDAQREALLAR